MVTRSFYIPRGFLLLDKFDMTRARFVDSDYSSAVLLN